jgi:predicted membrane-bound spermidine synthase
MDYPFIIYLSVGLIYGLGIVGLVGLIIQVWLWTLEKILVWTKIHKVILEWLADKRKNNVYTPKMKNSPFEQKD